MISQSYDDLENYLLEKRFQPYINTMIFILFVGLKKTGTLNQ